MEQYLKGRIKAFGHTCFECKYFKDFHCDNPHYRGSKARGMYYGDMKHTNPDEDACVKYDGKDELEVKDD